MVKELTAEDIADAMEYFGEDVLDGRTSRTSPATAWKPGQSGNTKGRPVEPDDATLTEWLVWTLGKTGGKKLAAELIALAMTPGVSPTKLAAVQYIYDRIEGKPRQSVATTTGVEHPLVGVFRRIADDTKALEGHRRPALTSISVYEDGDRDGDSENTGPDVP